MRFVVPEIVRDPGGRPRVRGRAQKPRSSDPDLRNALLDPAVAVGGTRRAALPDMDMHRIAVAVVAGAATLAVAGCSAETDDGGDDTEQTNEALSTRHTAHSISTISYAPNSYVIGNAYPGWTVRVQGNAQFSHGPGNESGVSYRWGFIYGEGFDHCAWLGNGTLAGPAKPGGASKCGAPQEIDTPHFLATYTNGQHNHLAGDGSLTRMHYAGSGCTDKHGYGNVDPWKVPATPANATGAVPDGRALRWRYVSKDGKWVMVHDPTNNGSTTAPNWYFVHRGCVSLSNAD